MELVAHRGFAAEGPENALPTLRQATALADAVEFDVRLAGDDEPVVVHDRTVDRPTDASSPVAAYSAAELARLEIEGSGGTIPSLAAVLEALTGPVVVDLKTDRVTDRLLALLGEYDGRVLVSSFGPDVLGDVPEDIDTAMLCAPPAFQDDLPDGTPADLQSAVALAKEVGAEAIHPHHSQCSVETVALAHEAGLRVRAWTVRSREVARELAATGVDGVIADSPDFVEG